ncbi:hypothetical protein [Labedaea rhizosphaerae]|uniref:cytidine deaminase family protein n=1 Tax=Labedaea rhizosphaerae TaxID=598644 RepID=UPI00105EA710
MKHFETGSIKDRSTHEFDLAKLVSAAWQAREHARVIGKTPVGAAVLSDNGVVYLGCNVEHRFRSHDIHAEVNALTTMVGADGGVAVAIAVASMREYFTPCGACMDWIFELGGATCEIHVSNAPSEVLLSKYAKDLMPFYPH